MTASAYQMVYKCYINIESAKKLVYKYSQWYSNIQKNVTTNCIGKSEYEFNNKETIKVPYNPNLPFFFEFFF